MKKSYLLIAMLAVVSLNGCDEAKDFVSSNTEQTSSNVHVENDHEEKYVDTSKKIVVTPVNDQKIKMGQRVALLIGNANYDYENILENPINDINLLGGTLEKQGFNDVRIISNGTRANMIRAIHEFVERANNAESAVFYFSGHGIQDSNHNNYLIPVESNIQYQSDIEAYGISTLDVVKKIDDAKALTSLIIFDACRDSGKGLSIKSSSKGLAEPSLPASRQRLVSYATRAGSIAQDKSKESGNNSPYAYALNTAFQHIDSIPLLTLLDTVADDVMRMTDRRQEPTRSGNLRADAYLIELDPDKVKTAVNIVDKPAIDSAELSLLKQQAKEAVNIYTNYYKHEDRKKQFEQLIEKDNPFAILGYADVDINLQREDDSKIDTNLYQSYLDKYNFDVQLITNLKSVANEDANIAYFIGDYYYWHDDKQKYIKYLFPSANNGNPFSTYVLGLCYLECEGIEKDESEAFRWINKSVQLGYIPAIRTLAYFHSNGIGTPVNKLEAIKLYSREEVIDDNIDNIATVLETMINNDDLSAKEKNEFNTIMWKELDITNDKTKKIFKLLNELNKKDFSIPDEIFTADSTQMQALIFLILATESMDKDERQYWFDIMPSMNDDQIARLHEILAVERTKLNALEDKYIDEIKGLNEKHLKEWEELQKTKE